MEKINELKWLCGHHSYLLTSSRGTGGGRGEGYFLESIKCVDHKKVTQYFSMKRDLFLVLVTMPRDMYVPKETKKIMFLYRIEGKKR